MSQFYQPITGLPGIQTNPNASFRQVFASADLMALLPGGKIIDGTKTRDAGNADFASVVRSGTLMGKVTATGKYANAIIGLSTLLLASADTTLKTSAAIGAEIVRRIGASGTLNLIGPPTAAGVVRTLTLTYSAVAANGDVTITAPGVNEVQAVALGATMTAGRIAMTATKSDGTLQTAEVPYNTSWTQTVADLQTAINALLGTSAVALAVAATHDMTVTFSGTGYAAMPQPFVVVDASNATTTTTSIVTRTTAGVDGRMVTTAIIGDTDGSQLPLAFIADGYGVKTTDGSGVSKDTVFAANGNMSFPISGTIDPSVGFINWPADASLRTWVKNSLNSVGRYIFIDGF